MFLSGRSEIPRIALIRVAAICDMATTPENQAVFDAKQTFMYSVFAEHLQTDINLCPHTEQASHKMISSGPHSNRLVQWDRAQGIGQAQPQIQGENPSRRGVNKRQ